MPFQTLLYCREQLEVCNLPPNHDSGLNSHSENCEWVKFQRAYPFILLSYDWTMNRRLYLPKLQKRKYLFWGKKLTLDFI